MGPKKSTHRNASSGPSSKPMTRAVVKRLAEASANPTASVGNEGSSPLSSVPSSTVEINNPMDLEYVEDDFEEGEHKKMDEMIPKLFAALTPEYSDELLPHVLYHISKHSGGRLHPKYHLLEECEIIIKSEPGLRNLLLEGSKRGYKSVRLLKLLRPAPTFKHDKDDSGATENAWKGDYRGDGAKLLWTHIGECYNMLPTDPNRCYYAKYCAIVQSSGMGKSRAVDEMSKSHFVIPVNLRRNNSTGYPPPDGAVYEYLSRSGSPRDAFFRSCSFLHGLFVQTAAVLKDMQEPRAENFWKYMNGGMVLRAHGAHRKEFYDAVETLATGFYSTYLEYFLPDKLPSDSEMDGKLRSPDFPLCKPLEELCKVLENEPVSESLHEPARKRRKLDSESQEFKYPLAVLAFDEVHTLTELRDNASWSCFIEMRRAIRGLHKLPLFTLFLSTSGTLFGITPSPGRDLSTRMFLEGEVMTPFCELGFDMFANRLDFNNPVKLSQVTSDEHLISYGRPLFPLINQKQDETIFTFAAQKLLCSSANLSRGTQPLSEAQMLACLAARIPIEFLSTAYASQVSDLEKEQVHSHMRVVLKVDRNLETLATTSPSEPVLSEAAYYVMAIQPQFSPPQVLQTILNGFAVNKGELGELIVALLFTMARDKAVGLPDDCARPCNNQRWCSLTGLLTSLFRTPFTTSKGWHFTAEGPNQTEFTLADIFKDSKVYFNHFIEVHEHAVIHVKYLVRLMARGAAVLCANGQHAVDGIIPFLLEGDEIRPDNIGIIMFQVKNDARYSSNPDWQLFLAMDPFSLKILEPSTKVPIIRIVFALAAQTSSFTLVDYEKKEDPKGKGKEKEKARPSLGMEQSYTTYDFWVSGLSPEFLVPVGNEQSVWNSLLQTCSPWRRLYSDELIPFTTQRRSMNPGVAVDDKFWENWCFL